MVNKAKTYNPTANDAFLTSVTINTFDKEADAINLKKLNISKH